MTKLFPSLGNVLGGLLSGLTLSAAAWAQTVTLTSPTNNQVFTAPASISLKASTSGTGIKRVEFYQGGTLVATDTTSPYGVTWSSVAAGSYSLTARAKNSAGTVVATSSAIAIVVNAPPTVSLTAPTAGQGFATGSTITLAATAADSDGTVSKVDFYRGTTRIGTDTSSPYTITWSNAAAGSYSLTAKATDNRGATKTSTAVAIVVAAPPTVTLTSPTANQLFSAPANVTLAATATPGSGSTLTKVEFYQGTTLIGTDTTAPYSLTWSNVPAGSHSLTAKATNSRNIGTTSAAVPIVVNAAPTIAITSPTHNQVVGAPANVTIAATAADPDGSIAKVDFYQGTTLIGTATAAPYSVVWNSVPSGSYTLTAQATDNQGVVTTSTPITLIVNTPPTVILTSPTAGQKFTAPASIALSATVADADGSIASVAYFQNGNPIGTATTAPFGYAWDNVPQGTYSLTVQATDNRGTQTTSAPVSITVNPAGPALGTYYIHPDHLGTPRVITDNTSTIVWRWDNAEPFGNTPPNPDPQAAGTSFPFNLRFPGQYADAESGLAQNYFRDYDPATGRYVEADPIGLAGGSMSLYTYADNAPTMKTDPLGLMTCQWVGPVWVCRSDPPPSFFPPFDQPSNPGVKLPTVRMPKWFPNWTKSSGQCEDEREECKQECADTLERDEAECLVAKVGYGRAAQAICLGRAKEFYAQCLRRCDGK